MDAFIAEFTNDDDFDAFLNAFCAHDDVKHRNPDDWDYDELEEEYQKSLSHFNVWKFLPRHILYLTKLLKFQTGPRASA